MISGWVQKVTGRRGTMQYPLPKSLMTFIFHVFLRMLCSARQLRPFRTLLRPPKILNFVTDNQTRSLKTMEEYFNISLQKMEVTVGGTVVGAPIRER